MPRRAAAQTRDSSPPARPSTRGNPAPASPQAATQPSAKRTAQPASSAAGTPRKNRTKTSRSTKATSTASYQAAQRTLQSADEVDQQQQQFAARDVEGQDVLDNSILSGATAVSSPDSVTEITGLQANGPALVKSLPDLNDDSSRILRMLAPRNVTEQSVATMVANLRKRGSDSSKLLQRCETQFKDSYDQFRVSTPFVFPDIVLRALFGSEQLSPAALWRPDDILHKANLAIVLIIIMTSGAPIDETKELLIHVDNGISRLFFSSLQERHSSPGQSALVDETFELALEIRTQIAVGLLLRNEDEGVPANRTSVVYSTFLTDPDGVIDPAIAKMRGWNTPILQADEVSLTEEYRELVSQRCQVLCDVVSSSESLNLIQLEHEFPWRSFQAKMAIWAAARAKEIDSQILIQQGAEEIALALEEELERRRATAKHQSQVGSFMAFSKALGQRAKNLLGRSIIPPSTLQQQNEDQDEIIVAQESLPTAPSPPPPPHVRAAPRKRLIDRQEDAQKVSFAETQQTQSDPVTQDDGFQPSITASGKKRAGQRRSDSRAISGLQNSPTKRRAAQQETGTPSRRKRVRTTEDVPYEPEPEPEPEEQEIDDDDEERSRSRSTIPPSSNYASVNENARLITNLRMQAKVPQKRRPWSAEECDALIYYIEIYGISWTTIKQKDENMHGAVLQGRDQVALKDKARNMKFDYLKAGVILPPNFERIPLDRKLRDKLDAYGIDPDS